MSNKEILNQEFKKFGCLGILGEDGKIYQAILSAMDKVKQAAETNQTAEAPEPQLTERQKKFYEVANKLNNEIDFTKRGAIAYSLLRFCEEMNGATFTELNMFWKNKDYTNYNSKNDRGGSLTKWLNELRKYKKRVYNNNELQNFYLYKGNDNKWHLS